MRLDENNFISFVFKGLRPLGPAGAPALRCTPLKTKDLHQTAAIVFICPFLGQKKKSVQPHFSVYKRRTEAYITFMKQSATGRGNDDRAHAARLARRAERVEKLAAKMTIEEAERIASDPSAPIVKAMAADVVLRRAR